MGNDDRQRRVAAISDMSGFGRCSLTVALPILSAMGVQVCPLPTAVLSTHTMFPGFISRDLSDQLLPIARHWKSQQVKLDAIGSGYQGGLAALCANYGVDVE